MLGALLGGCFPVTIYVGHAGWKKVGAQLAYVPVAAVPLLAMDDPDLSGETRDANFRMAARLIARLPIVVAVWHRIRQGLDVLPPNGSLSHAANFLWLLPPREKVRKRRKDS